MGRARRPASPVTPQRPGPSLLEGRWPVVAILGIAVLLRMAHVLALRATPWFEHLVVDPEYYDAWARRIAAGDWIGDRPFYMDPLYPYVLAVVYRFWGRDLLAVRLLNVALGAGSCALVARLGRRVGGPAVGILAALGLALYKPEIFYVGEIDKTCLSVFLTAATLTLAVERSAAARLGAGVALGLAALTRANFLLLAPAGILALLVWHRPRAAGVPGPLASAVFVVAGLAVVLTPVAWRNHHVAGEWVLTTSQAGQNFYIGNNPLNPSGAYGTLPFVRGNPHFEEADFRAEAEARVGRPLGPREVSHFWFAEAAAHMREHPAFAARAMVRKLCLFWNDFEISDNQDQYLLARDSWVLRLPLLGFGCIAPLALLGALVAFRSQPGVRLLCGFVLLYYASVVAFFMFSRYRIQVVPALLPLAAIGGLTLATRLRAGEWLRAATAGAIVLGAALFCFQTIDVFSASNEQVVEMQLSHLGEVYLDAGNQSRAIDAFREAVQTCPLRCRRALAELADTYLATGRLEEGAAFFRAFTRDHPQNPDGPRHLARLAEAVARHVEPAATAP